MGLLLVAVLACARPGCTGSSSRSPPDRAREVRGHRIARIGLRAVLVRRPSCRVLAAGPAAGRVHAEARRSPRPADDVRLRLRARAGCLSATGRRRPTDARGEVVLDAAPRRDGRIPARRTIALGGARARASRRAALVAVGDRATVVLPRMLAGAAPEVDADESDLVARLNGERAAAGLPLAQVNARLAAAADMQAAWLVQSAVAYDDPPASTSARSAARSAFASARRRFPMRRAEARSSPAA